MVLRTCIIMMSFGRLTFNGYFNLIYIAKRKKYTNLTGIKFKNPVKRLTKSLILMHDKDDIQEIELDGENEKDTWFHSI